MSTLTDYINQLIANQIATSSDRNLFTSPNWSVSAPSFPVNRSCWAYGLDLSCISPFNDAAQDIADSGAGQGYLQRRRGGTLVTPRHFICVGHAEMAPNNRLWFQDANGNNGAWYTIVNRTTFDLTHGDIEIGQLDRDVVGVHPVNVLPDNWQLYITGNGANLKTVATNIPRINSTRAGVTVVDPDADCGTQHDSKEALAYDTGSTGDIGANSFNGGYLTPPGGATCSGDSGQPTLIFITPTLRIDTLATANIDRINSTIASFGSNGGYQLTPLPLAPYMRNNMATTSAINPLATVIADDWTNQGGAGSILLAVSDASDATFAQLDQDDSLWNNGGTLYFTLNLPSFPGTITAYSITVRGSASSGSTEIDAQLVDSGGSGLDDPIALTLGTSIAASTVNSSAVSLITSSAWAGGLGVALEPVAPAGGAGKLFKVAKISVTFDYTLPSGQKGNLTIGGGMRLGL